SERWRARPGGWGTKPRIVSGFVPHPHRPSASAPRPAPQGGAAERARHERPQGQPTPSPQCNRTTPRKPTRPERTPETTPYAARRRTEPLAAGGEGVLGGVGAVVGRAERGERLARAHRAPVVERRVGLGARAAPREQQLVGAVAGLRPDDDLAGVRDRVEDVVELARGHVLPRFPARCATLTFLDVRSRFAQRSC